MAKKLIQKIKSCKNIQTKKHHYKYKIHIINLNLMKKWKIQNKKKHKNKTTQNLIIIPNHSKRNCVKDV